MPKIVKYMAIVLGAIALTGLTLIAILLFSAPNRKPSGKTSIEFRVLADRRHDAAAIEQAMSPEGLTSPPEGYRWAPIDERGSYVGATGNAMRQEALAGSPARRYVLVKLDRYNINEGDIARLYETYDERGNPALGFVMSATGARRLGNLTRQHQPEDGGRFRYQMAILIGGQVISAPFLNTEIRGSGIIEWGDKRATFAEIERLMSELTR
jgi:preprotein translocase subunit SecD